LGIRPVAYRPNIVDYGIYVAKRNEFLLSPRGIAALTHGGLIGRIAREVMPSTHAIFGIPFDAQLHGTVHRHATGDLLENTLSDVEKELICGVYRIYTGRGNQTSQLSWWPAVEAWNSSGYNVGYWCSATEEWYQARIVEIEGHIATGHT
ncbi:hypothetical protein OF83DRAFT_1029170, partial [Amylostereum chailletii]